MLDPAATQMRAWRCHAFGNYHALAIETLPLPTPRNGELLVHVHAFAPGFPDMLMAAQAKVFTSENAIQIVNDALQFFGARGYSRNNPIERMARDVRMFTIGGGTAEVLRNVVASSILGKKLPQTRGGYLPRAAE